VNILLTTINAKWIHPSLALRLLKANLGALEDTCEIIEFNLRQPLGEKVEPLLAAHPRILGISVSIWNHTATVELLGELEKAWAANSAQDGIKPVVVLGGPEVSHLPQDAEIFRYADYVIRGEGETAFRALCEEILTERPETARERRTSQLRKTRFIEAAPVKLDEIKSGYHLYTDEDLAKKLVYVEASRGCPFNCEFCLSAVKDAQEQGAKAVREFPLEPFLAQMDALIARAGETRNSMTFKFLDRTFNINIKRAVRICEFFLEKLAQGKKLVVHFEMVPSIFPPELRETLSRFPPGTLRLEIGIQTLNEEVSARIGRPSNSEKELEATLQAALQDTLQAALQATLQAIRFLREKTNAIIHADLIAGLPGEDLASFGAGFDRLWLALNSVALYGKDTRRAEIQLGILKLLPGAPIARHSETFSMRYNPLPPYEVVETSAMSAGDLSRIKNFARFWELVVNRGLVNYRDKKPVFEEFMALSDFLFAKFGKNWGIDRGELQAAVKICLKQLD
jgi:radical SAM superfamily enzyme YgiQ (UPF0313 family)